MLRKKNQLKQQEKEQRLLQKAEAAAAEAAKKKAEAEAAAAAEAAKKKAEAEAAKMAAETAEYEKNGGFVGGLVSSVKNTFEGFGKVFSGELDAATAPKLPAPSGAAAAAPSPAPIPDVGSLGKQLSVKMLGEAIDSVRSNQQIDR